MENKNINERELEILKFWEEEKIFEKSLQTPAGEQPVGNFPFYDGPPFATGLPHHGHLLAGTIKDVIPRFQTMNGYHVRRVWGWDCHGLPIENLIEKKFNLNSKKDIEEFGIARFNEEAEKSVFQYEEQWKKIIPRVGRWIEMEHPYKTMDAIYTESVWWGFNKLYRKGLVSEGYKSMHICPRCETTLAQSEVALGYKDLTDISVTAKFKLLGERDTYALAWTTTPWTLPGNVALAVNPKFYYVKVKVNINQDKIRARDASGLAKRGGILNDLEATIKFEYFILAKERVSEVLKDYEYEITEEFTGEKLLGKKYEPVFPYYEKADLENKENLYKIVGADFVDLETGTGIVHIAPAFGEDDLNLATKEKLPIIKHVGMNGEFVEQVKDFAGRKVKTSTDNQSADIEIIKYLAAHGTLFSKKKFTHSYPTCYRCGTPLLNYATSSWFIESPKLKNKMLQENDQVNWIPETIQHGRFGKWLENTRDWAISRSRYWGAPIPIWKEIGGKEIRVVGSLDELANRNLKTVKNTYYLMRHGEAKHNVEDIEDTEMDPKDCLTDKGITQVKKTKKKNGEFDVIVSSPYCRTLETAKIMAKGDEHKIIINNDFREIELGSWNGKVHQDVLEHYGVDYFKFDTKFPDGESNRDAMHRMLKGILELEEKYEGKKILIISHGTPIQMAIASAELIPEQDIIADATSSHPKYYLAPAKIRKLKLKLVPRDKTGRINLHRPYIDEIYLKSKKGKKMERIKDVFDCWVESGSMPFAQLHYPFENSQTFKRNFPAEFIAEGLDQTRGWFNTLLNISTGVFGQSAYKNVIVNGLLLAADGEKMSKSKNNYTDPMVLVEKYGADAFRQTLLTTPAMQGESVIFSDDLVEETYKKVVQKLENVLRFYEMLNLDREYVSAKGESVIDTWIISRLDETLATITEEVKSYHLDKASRPIEGFIDDLSTWWLRLSRERLKGDDGQTEKERASLTLQKVLNIFSRTIAPFMPFLAERIYLEVSKNNREKKLSVHLESWPKKIAEVDQNLLQEMSEVRNLVTEALKLRQKNNLPVRQPLAKLFTKLEIDKKYWPLLEKEINVKEIVIEPNRNYEADSQVMLDLELTPELKQEGIYRELVRKVKDLRKENNLSAEALVKLEIAGSEAYLADLRDFAEKLKQDTNLSEVNYKVGEEKFTLVK